MIQEVSGRGRQTLQFCYALRDILLRLAIAIGICCLVLCFTGRGDYYLDSILQLVRKPGQFVWAPCI